MIRFAPIIRAVKTGAFENNSSAGPKKAFHFAVAPFWEPAKILGTFRERLVAHRLKHLKIFIAFPAVILVSRHAGNAAVEESTIQAAERAEIVPSLAAPHLLTLDAPPVKGSTEKFLCLLHFIG